MLFLEAATHLLSFDDKIIQEAQKSLLMVDTVDGFGSAVLIGPKTVLTASHNFDLCRPKRAQIVHPTTGEKSKIERVRFFGQKDNPIDLAVVTIVTPFAGPFAVLDDVTPVEKSIPVMLPRFFHPKRTDLIRPNNPDFQISIKIRSCSLA